MGYGKNRVLHKEVLKGLVRRGYSTGRYGRAMVRIGYCTGIHEKAMVRMGYCMERYANVVENREHEKQQTGGDMM